MTEIHRMVMVAVLATPIGLGAAQGPSQAVQQSPGETPPAPAAARAVPGTVECPAPAPPATPPARSFNAPAGMLLIPVLSSKVADFEKFLGYVREGLAKSTDATLREQAKSLKFMKVAEPGPNGDVLFALVADPAVPCVDYGFQPVLVAAIPDQQELGEVWKLYQNSVRNGGHLMNFVPVK